MTISLIYFIFTFFQVIYYCTGQNTTTTTPNPSISSTSTTTTTTTITTIILTITTTVIPTIKINVSLSNDNKVLMNWETNIQTNDNSRYEIEVINIEKAESYIYPGKVHLILNLISNK